DIRPSCIPASGCVLQEGDESAEPPTPGGPIEAFDAVPLDPPAELCCDDDRRRSTEVSRLLADLRVTGDQVVEHLPTRILHEEVGEVVARLRAPHLAEVDHAGVHAVALIDVGRVEVAVSEAARRLR